MNATLKKIVKLKDKTSMQTGIYVKTDLEGEIGYLQLKDISPDSSLDYSQISMAKDTGISGKYWLRKNDLLFAAKGASNYCVLYEGFERNIVASSSFIIIRLTCEDILPEFLCCFLNTPSILATLKNSSVGTGIQMIPQSVLGDLQLAVPTVQVQQHLVRIDQLRREGECVQNRISELKRLVQDQLLIDSLK